MKLILQAIKSLLNKINIRLAKLEDKTSDESIAAGKLLPDGTPFIATVPISLSDILTERTAYIHSGVRDFCFKGKTALTLTAGYTYTVCYNGAEYTCECKIGDYGGEIFNPGCYLGNGELVKGEISSEPFAVFVHDDKDLYEDEKYLVLTRDDLEAVEISITGKSEYIRKMDERLLPDGASPLIIDASYNSSTGVVAIESGHLYSDLFHAIEKEKRDVIIWCNWDWTRRVLRFAKYNGVAYVFSCFESESSTYISSYGLIWESSGEIECTRRRYSITA